MKKKREKMIAENITWDCRKKIIPCIIIFITMLLVIIPTKAEGNESMPISLDKKYQMDDGSNFATENNTMTGNYFSYGKQSLGSLSIYGNMTKDKYGDMVAYTSNDYMTLMYYYDGGLDTKIKEKWKIESSKGEMINYHGIEKKIKNGAILVLRSEDNIEWENVQLHIDALKKEVNKNVYTISKSEVQHGYYYKVYVAYRIGNEMGGKNYKECLEEYNFYVGYSDNPVQFKDVSNDGNLNLVEYDENNKSSSIITVEYGFKMNKLGNNCTLVYSKGGGKEQDVSEKTVITEKGDYLVTVTDNLEREKKYRIEITTGLSETEIAPTVYENSGKKPQYIEENALEGYTTYGAKSLTNIKIAQPGDKKIVSAGRESYMAYGIDSENAFIYMNLNNARKISDTGWEISSDKYGGKNNEKIGEAWIGEIKTGAILIQKSRDGIEWENVNDGKYANGLYTTDYYSYYANNDDTLIYMPDGNDILNGVYLKITYVYKIYNKYKKQSIRFVESYKMYLCSNNLDAVTFHNLTNEKEEKNVSYDGNEDGNEAGKEHKKLYDLTETLVSGSGTFTGFQVDNSLNPTVTYSIKYNGVPIEQSEENIYTSGGRYDIVLESEVGTTKAFIIYVNEESIEQAEKTYFGEGFITDGSERIYDEDSKCPVYVAGKTTYSLEEVTDEYLPLKGTIKNEKTDEIINIPHVRSAWSGALEKPGDYIATFTTQYSASGQSLPGDYFVFTFRFKLIEDGTQPGPVINERELKEYAITTASDAYPMFYSYTMQSADDGTITYVFREKDKAEEELKKVAGGMVEEEKDGKTSYIDESYKRKVVMNDGWKTADAVYGKTKDAVEIGYFDITDERNYRTLSDKTIADNSNLRKLELKKSIVVFADGQKAEFCNLDNSIPFINDKPRAIIEPGKEGKIDYTPASFKFIKAKNGYDSNSIYISDCNKKLYSIKYNVSVGEQLKEANCPSGVITIIERTKYGRINKYNAIYIKEGENTSQLKLKVTTDSDERVVEFNQHTKAIKVLPKEVYSFTVDSVTDELDKYNLVRVERKSDPCNYEYYVADQLPSIKWEKPDVYTVTVINRLGYNYSFTITVVKKPEYHLTVKNQLGDVVSEQIIKAGESYKLPVIEEEGYEFVGWQLNDEILENKSEFFAKQNINYTLVAVMKKVEVEAIEQEITTDIQEANNSSDNVAFIDITTNEVTSTSEETEVTNEITVATETTATAGITTTTETTDATDATTMKEITATTETTATTEIETTDMLETSNTTEIITDNKTAEATLERIEANEKEEVVNKNISIMMIIGVVIIGLLIGIFVLLFWVLVRNKKRDKENLHT